ncbi:collagen alpha-1(I) chain [Physeter macrocephalus]|uniref:Collagen alpha-1(I) chain n=1 Tax=Physeter macrocephalus TaxID=9755 RepID=A0A2Y9SZ75_PHYMC|nr:collagen alpha-1(I) chain [Physeter catodon]|eukprot:XP_023981870.1 G-protein-signaling modulator 1 [Physeter catodon]
MPGRQAPGETGAGALALAQTPVSARLLQGPPPALLERPWVEQQPHGPQAARRLTQPPVPPAERGEAAGPRPSVQPGALWAEGPPRRSSGAVTRLLEGVECSVGQPPSGARGTPGLPTEPAILQPLLGYAGSRPPTRWGPGGLGTTRSGSCGPALSLGLLNTPRSGGLRSRPGRPPQQLARRVGGSRGQGSQLRPGADSQGGPPELALPPSCPQGRPGLGPPRPGEARPPTRVSMPAQSSRIDDQRCPPPDVLPRGPTMPDEDFFSLIQRVQAKRMDEQRVDLAGSPEQEVGGPPEPRQQCQPGAS